MPSEFVVRTEDPAELDLFFQAHPAVLATVVATAAGYVHVGDAQTFVLHVARGEEQARVELEARDGVEIVSEYVRE